MKIIDMELNEWISRLYHREWEDFYHKSEKVKGVKDEMDELVEKLYKAKDLARYNESYAGSVEGIKDTLRKKQRDLADAIDAARKVEEERTAQAKADKRADKHLDISEEGQKIAKRAQKWAAAGVLLSTVIAFIALLMNYWLQSKRDADSSRKIQEEVKREIEVAGLRDLNENVRHNFELTGDLIKRLDVVEKQIAAKEKKKGTKVKPVTTAKPVTEDQ